LGKTAKCVRILPLQAELIFWGGCIFPSTVYFEPAPNEECFGGWSEEQARRSCNHILVYFGMEALTRWGKK
ncbi:MAG: hypothetical protein AAB967_00520, partial [Patescibacteria group bacterium]